MAGKTFPAFLAHAQPAILHTLHRPMIKFTRLSLFSNNKCCQSSSCQTHLLENDCQHHMMVCFSVIQINKLNQDAPLLVVPCQLSPEIYGVIWEDKWWYIALVCKSYNYQYAKVCFTVKFLTVIVDLIRKFFIPINSNSRKLWYNVAWFQKFKFNGLGASIFFNKGIWRLRLSTQNSICSTQLADDFKL